MTKKTANSDDLVEKIIEILDSKKAQNITSLNISKTSSIADYFIICEATSQRHAHTLYEEVVDKLKKEAIRPFRVDGEEAKDWIIVDYSSVILHIFRPETRQHYRLEELWTGKKRQTKKQ